MGIRFIGALVMVSAMTLALGAGQYRLLAQQRAPQPAAAAPAPQRGQQPAARPTRIAGHSPREKRGERRRHDSIHTRSPETA